MLGSGGPRCHVETGVASIFGGKRSFNTPYDLKMVILLISSTSRCSEVI